MAKLTSERGYQIRKENSEVLEKKRCVEHNLTQIGGSQTKIDGTDGESNFSIKNAVGSSTQVHLTTQNKFIESLNMNNDCSEFIRLFCGSKNINNNGKDRYTINQIGTSLTDSFKSLLEDNKIKIVDIILRNGDDVTHVLFFDTKNNKEYVLTYNEIIDKVSECSWVFRSGGIHLKNKNGKTFFHLQREGKKNPNSRFNVLWHIHKNLFL